MVLTVAADLTCDKLLPCFFDILSILQRSWTERLIKLSSLAFHEVDDCCAKSHCSFYKFIKIFFCKISALSYYPIPFKFILMMRQYAGQRAN